MNWVHHLYWFSLLAALLLCLADTPVAAQPVVREFYQRSASVVFDPNQLLGQQGRRAAPALIQALESSAQGGTTWVPLLLQLLAQTGHPDAVRVLQRYLGEEVPVSPQLQAVARDGAISALVALDSPASRRALAEALRHPANKLYQSNIIEHCGKLRAAECSDAIVQFLRDSNSVSDSVLFALAQCDPAAAADVVRTRWRGKDASVRSHEVMVLGLAAEVGRQLLYELADREPRRLATDLAVELAWALGRVRDAGAAPRLRALLARGEPVVAYFAALSLASRGDRVALAEIRSARDLSLDRDELYQDGGADSDTGYFRRERLRLVEYHLGIDYALARLGETGVRARIEAVARGTDAAAAMLADSFLLGLGDKAAAGRLLERIGREMRRGFSSAIGDSIWNDSLPDVLQALIDGSPAEAAALLLTLAQVGHWIYKDLGERLFTALPLALRLQALVGGFSVGAFGERVAARDALRIRGEAGLPVLERAVAHMDQDGRVLAASFLGEFDDVEGAKLLHALQSRDPAWQVRRAAREALALRQGKAERPPSLASGLGGFVQYGQAEKIPSDLVGTCEHQGKVIVAGAQSLYEYDGYQWRNLEIRGLCPGAITAVASWNGQLYVFSSEGFATGHQGRLTCTFASLPAVRHTLADGKSLWLGTARGLYRFDGDVSRAEPGGPTRAVTALEKLGETLWVAYELVGMQTALRLQPSLAKTLLTGPLPPTLYRYAAGRFEAVEEPLQGYQGWKLPLEVHALAGSAQGRLLVGCSEGLLVLDGGRWDLLEDKDGYQPRYPVDAVWQDAAGAITALQGLWLDQRGQDGVWRRTQLGGAGQEAALVTASRITSRLVRENGDVWLVSGEIQIYGNRLLAGQVIRVAGPNPPERTAPPETVIVQAKAGEWRWQNPAAAIRPPDQERVFGRGQPIEVPAAQCSIEAAAQDPWDYDPVEFQFKLDERPWTEWQSGNGILTPLLSEGEHVVRARARDRAGHVDPTPAVLYLTVHTRGLAVVRILDGRFQEVFPSQYRLYQRQSIGKVEIENRATEPLPVKVNLKVQDLFDTPSSRSLTVPALGKAWVELVAPFGDRLLALTDGAQLQAVVEVSFEFEGIAREARRTFPLKIQPVHAIDWSEPRRLAAFINSADPLVEDLAARAFRAFSRSRGKDIPLMRNLALAAILFRALDAHGVRYKPDPQSPFSQVRPGQAVLDMVRFPGETLRDRVGDCDDLVVLFASLLEQVDVPVAVVAVEGHVFLLFDSGVAAENRAAFRIPATLWVERGGSLWIPLEVTALGRTRTSFEAAWAEAAEAYRARYRPRADQIFEVRQAWMELPPATLRQSPIPIGDEVAAAGLVEVESLVAGYRQAVLNAAPAGDGAAQLLTRGQLLAKGGLLAEAAAVLQQAAAKTPGDTFEVSYAQGVVAAGLRQNTQAVSALERAAALAQDNQQRFLTAVAMASTLQAAGELDRARKWCDQALTFNPGARFDSRYSPLLQLLRTEQKTKAASAEGPPPYFQLLLAGIPGS